MSPEQQHVEEALQTQHTFFSNRPKGQKGAAAAHGSDTGTSCSEKLWLPHPWKYSRSGWMGA